MLFRLYKFVFISFEKITMKKIFFILVFALNIQTFAQKAYVKEYNLTISGQISDENNKPLKSATIRTIYNRVPVAISHPDTLNATVDEKGKYRIVLKEFGLYNIEISGPNKIAYRVKCLYSDKMAQGIRDRKSSYLLNVQLLPQTSKVKIDIYNGGELMARGGKPTLVPYKRYLQAHDFEIRNGFKTTKKATKYIQKRIKKLQVSKVLGLLATRKEIDTIISNKVYAPEIRKRWKQFFGLTHPNIDKQRAELTQDFFTKISQKNEEGELVYKYKSHTLDLTKTVQADDSKKVFNLYRYNFESTDGKTLSYDVMLFRTLSGWKINHISEIY